MIGCDIAEQRNRETVASVEAAGGTMTGMAPVDLSDPEQARAWVEEAAAIHSQIDVVYNNASGARFGLVPNLSVEDWQAGMRNELDLVFYVTKLPGLTSQNGAVSSSRPDRPPLISRHRVRDLPRTAPPKVPWWRCPASSRPTAHPTASAPSRSAQAPFIVPRSRGACLSKVPGAEQILIGKLLANRIGTPEDVAGLAVFVASDDAAWMTGVDILLDGGYTAHDGLGPPTQPQVT